MRIMDKDLDAKYVGSLYEKSRKYLAFLFTWLFIFTVMNTYKAFKGAPDSLYFLIRNVTL